MPTRIHQSECFNKPCLVCVKKQISLLDIYRIQNEIRFCSRGPKTTVQSAPDTLTVKLWRAAA
ncbi:UNVERIFIED_CONTAM: hypothetical protein K2H54_050689, partial [Gekko kuhli]